MTGVAAAEHAGRVDRALADVGLPPERFADRYPHELSGGQRQRVAIAAALVLDPDGLICDEPVSMLDVSVQAQVLKVLMDLRESRSLALLFITHDLGLAWTLCDRIAVMYLGRIVEQGSAQQVDRESAPPLHAGAGGGGAVPRPRVRLATAGRRRARRCAHPAGLPPAPALPAPLRAVRHRGPAAVRGGRRRARRRLPAAQDTITVRLCSRMNCVR